MKCRHKQWDITWSDVNNSGKTAEDASAFALHCYDCGERMSLGPSNDGPSAVQEEIGIARMLAFSGLGEQFHIWIDENSDLEIEMNADAWPWDPTRPIAEQGPTEVEMPPQAWLDAIARPPVDPSALISLADFIEPEPDMPMRPAIREAISDAEAEEIHGSWDRLRETQDKPPAEWKSGDDSRGDL